MKSSKLFWIAIALLLPVSAEAQQGPQLIGDGARVYAANCSRCHNARSSTERTDGEWALVVAHMRARAGFTRTEARAVLAYLQATNRPEGSAGPSGSDVQATGIVLSPLLRDFLRGETVPQVEAPTQASRGGGG